ncbi:MAG: hypothetical protein PVH40_09150 [Gemmatimonadales bacterium]|jgi:hypothetical protein
MKSLLTLVTAFTVSTVPVLQAQDPTAQGRPWIAEFSHWGRWVTLAGAAGLVATAAVRHSDAQAALSELEDFCAQDVSACLIVNDPGGNERYLTPEAEALYQQYAALEQSARGFLFGGQLTLLTSGAMFLIDVIHKTEDIDNIPYTPLELYTTGNKLGLALRF